MQLKSFQVTSSVIDEGKTLVAGNVAVTLAKYSGSKTLLVEGDLHRPSLASLFGLSELRGLNHWWSGGDSGAREVRLPIEWNAAMVSSCRKALRSAFGPVTFCAVC